MNSNDVALRVQLHFSFGNEVSVTGVLSGSLGLIRHSQGASLFLEAAGHYLVEQQEVHP